MFERWKWAWANRQKLYADVQSLSLSEKALVASEASRTSASTFIGCWVLSIALGQYSLAAWFFLFSFLTGTVFLCASAYMTGHEHGRKERDAVWHEVTAKVALARKVAERVTERRVH